MYKNSEKEQVKGYQAKPMDVVREYYDNPLWYDQCEIDQEMIDMGMAKNFTLIRKAPTSEYPEGEWIEGYRPDATKASKQDQAYAQKYRELISEMRCRLDHGADSNGHLGALLHLFTLDGYVDTKGHPMNYNHKAISKVGNPDFSNPQTKEME